MYSMYSQQCTLYCESVGLTSTYLHVPLIIFAVSAISLLHVIFCHQLCFVEIETSV